MKTYAVYTHIYIHQKTCFFTAECILISQYHENCVHLPPPLTPLPRVTRQIYKNTLLISRQKSQPPPMTSAAWIPFFTPFHFHFSFPAVHLRHKKLSPLSLFVATLTYHTVYGRWTAWLNVIPCPLCSKYQGKMYKNTKMPSVSTLSDTESH